MRTAVDAAVEGNTSEEAAVNSAEMATSAGFASTSDEVSKIVESIIAAQNGGELPETQLESVSGGLGLEFILKRSAAAA